MNTPSKPNEGAVEVRLPEVSKETLSKISCIPSGETPQKSLKIFLPNLKNTETSDCYAGAFPII